jgi:hypothetical protein
VRSCAGDGGATLPAGGAALRGGDTGAGSAGAMAVEASAAKLALA